jgi:hypothetical protein
MRRVQTLAGVEPRKVVAFEYRKWYSLLSSYYQLFDGSDFDGRQFPYAQTHLNHTQQPDAEPRVQKCTLCVGELAGNKPDDDGGRFYNSGRRFYALDGEGRSLKCSERQIGEIAGKSVLPGNLREQTGMSAREGEELRKKPRTMDKVRVSIYARQAQGRLTSGGD